MNLFNHVQIKVKDLIMSRRFYDAVFSALGYSVVLDIPDEILGYGTSIHNMFEIRQLRGEYLLSQSIHLAFNAATREDVDAFYHAALANGATCKGKPGFRPQFQHI